MENSSDRASCASVLPEQEAMRFSPLNTTDGAFFILSLSSFFACKKYRGDRHSRCESAVADDGYREAILLLKEVLALMALGSSSLSLVA